MGWHALRRLLLSGHIDTSFPKWALHSSASGCLANVFWTLRAVSDVSRISAISKLLNNHGHHPLVLPGAKRFSHRSRAGKDLSVLTSVPGGVTLLLILLYLQLHTTFHLIFVCFVSRNMELIVQT